jgi:hypothetical protein
MRAELSVHQTYLYRRMTSGHQARNSGSFRGVSTALTTKATVRRTVYE